MKTILLGFNRRSVAVQGVRTDDATPGSTSRIRRCCRRSLIGGPRWFPEIPDLHWPPVCFYICFEHCRWFCA